MSIHVSIFERCNALPQIDAIERMSGDFYREGGFDHVTLGEMLFSVCELMGIHII